MSLQIVSPTGGIAPLLRAEGVSLEYGQRRASHDVSFDLYRGDRLVLLKAAGVLTPAAGSISIIGVLVSGPGLDRMVVFQEFDQLPPWKTVLENVMFPLLVSKRVSRHKARERAMQPEVLLMDEPFVALDALTRRRMQEELRFTLLFVTHSIEEALVVGNRILLLSPHPGQVRAELNGHQFDLGSAGSAEFQAATQRIHGLLFGPVVPAQAGTHAEPAGRRPMGPRLRGDDGG